MYQSRGNLNDYCIEWLANDRSKDGKKEKEEKKMTDQRSANRKYYTVNELGMLCPSKWLCFRDPFGAICKHFNWLLCISFENGQRNCPFVLTKLWRQKISIATTFFFELHAKFIEFINK